MNFLLTAVAFSLSVAAGSPVVKVVAFRGEVTVDQGKVKRGPVAVDQLLERSDTLHLGLDGLLFLQVVSNQQVVRLDSDLDLKVGDIAQLGAVARGGELGQEFDRLLATNERAAFNTRMTGWNVSKAAVAVPGARAESEPPLEKSTAKKKEVAARPAAVGGGASESTGQSSGKSFGSADHGYGDKAASSESVAPARAAAAAPAPPPPPPGAAAPAKAAPSAPASPAAAPPAPTEASEDSGPGGAEAKASKSPSARADVARPVVPAKDLDLRACILGEAEKLEPAVKKSLKRKLAVQWRVAPDGTVRVRYPRALPVPRCALEWFERNRAVLPPQAGPGWASFVVRLK